MYAAIRHYRFDPKGREEIDREIREGFLPLIRKAGGFVHYYWLDTGTGEGASVDLFEDKAGADESVRLTADCVRENVAHLISQKPVILQGPVVAHDGRCGTPAALLRRKRALPAVPGAGGASGPRG